MAGRIVLVSAAVLLLGGAAGCGQASSPSPSSPSSVPQTASPPIFAGIWQGQYKITTCEGERDCWFRVGSTRPYVLRLSQAGATITGIVEAMSFVVDVTGEVTNDGQVTLTGSRPATSGWDGMSAVAVSLTGLRLDDGNGLAGEFWYTLDHTGDEWPYPHLAHGATILGGTRGPLPVRSPAALAAYEGVWAGTYVIESCQFEGWASCWPETLDGAYTLALELRVNGDALEGELTLPGGTRAPVTATVSLSGIGTSRSGVARRERRHKFHEHRDVECVARRLRPPDWDIRVPSGGTAQRPVSLTSRDIGRRWPASRGSCPEPKESARLR